MSSCPCLNHCAVLLPHARPLHPQDLSRTATTRAAPAAITPTAPTGDSHIPNVSRASTPVDPGSSSPWAEPSPPHSAAVPDRFVASGGLYALFLLLHHELSGVHHSKMASSLVSLLNIVLDAGLELQVRVTRLAVC